jgi:hypothetical protein
MTIKLASLPTASEKNLVNERLQAAIDYGFEEVFIIGVKDGRLKLSYSGYKDIERKLGALELLKQDMIAESYS